MIRKVDQFEPNVEAVADYERLYPIFGGVYPALKTSFAELSQYESQ
jgi:hypothetical protein